LTLVAPSAVRAQAAPEPVALEWTAPVGCPDRSAVLAETGQLLSKLAEAPGREPLKARGRVERRGALWKLRLEIESKDGPGARDFEDESCLRLSQVAALALALAVDSSAAPAPAARPVEPVTKAARRFFVRVQLGGDLGSLRAPSPGPGLAVGVLLGRARVEAVGNYWLPQQGNGIEDQLIEGGLRACVALVETPEIGACMGLEGGQLKGHSLVDGKSLLAPWLAILVGAAVGWSFTDWLALRMEAGLGLTLLSPTFDFAHQGARSAAVFGRLVAGIEYHF
jgi:hypothetical protein